MTSAVSIDFRLSPEVRVNLSSLNGTGVTSYSSSFGAAVSATESAAVERSWDAMIVRSRLGVGQLGTSL